MQGGRRKPTKGARRFLKVTMPSERKIAANRGNARKSTGPRSARGKAHTAQNALRHGLASTAFLERSASSEVERMAKAIAGDSALTLEYEQALIIAESDFIIRKVRTAAWQKWNECC